MPMPLDGIRVVDWTIFQQGPVASSMLGDLGAEVIKIEELGKGDPARGLAGVAGLNAGLPGGRTYYFEVHNRNKKSVALDLKKPRSRELIYRLVERSDVFVQNFRQGVAERLGLDYDTLVKHNPKLIYASATGYGPEGPESHRPSLDPVGLARTGFLELFGSLDSEEPHYPQGGIADQMGAIMLAYGVMGALVARERLGIGQKVDCSHLSSMMWLQSLSIHAYLLLGRKLPRFQHSRSANPLMNFYRCKDGKWLFLSLMQADRYWPDFCQALGRADLETDSRFDDSDRRKDNREELISVIEEVFATRTCAEWVSIFQEFRDFIYEPVNSVTDLLDDPQVLANNYIVDFLHPSLGSQKVVNVPVTYSETPGGIRLPAPECGQHTEEVLTEVCGYSWEEVAELREAEVI
jgi:crotonobetainyl-CoA:carnitine CoA-transferase CaiB-like acyl-CoA transferase